VWTEKEKLKGKNAQGFAEPRLRKGNKKIITDKKMCAEGGYKTVQRDHDLGFRWVCPLSQKPLFGKPL